MSSYDLSSISTTPPKSFDKKDIKKETKKLIERLGELQNLLYASHKHSLIVVVQGMDASGKGGAVRNVFSEVNPLGVNVHSFKKPTEEEMDHDMLWRVHKVVPRKGMIAVFDRSHYEEVLITRVMGWCDDETAKKRFEHINNFERLLKDYNCHVIKFYLHISEEEQEQRFYERITMPHKNWKYGAEDFEKAKQWPAYRKVYQDVFENCGKENPWIIVPSDTNWFKEYTIAKTLVDKIESFNLEYPIGDVDASNPDVIRLKQKYGEA